METGLMAGWWPGRVREPDLRSLKPYAGEGGEKI